MSYARQTESARRLIAKFGGPCVWSVPIPGEEPTLPWQPEDNYSWTNHNIHAAVLPSKLVYRDVPPAERGTHTAYFVPVNFTPTLQDKVTWSGEVYRVKKLDMLNPDGASVVLCIAELTT